MRSDSHSSKPLSLPPLEPGPTPGEPSPASAYLNSLSPSGRRTQRAALNNLAFVFSAGRISDAERFPWQNLRYEHTSGLSAYLVDIGYAKSSVNKHLVALRRVLEEAYRLGLFADHNDYYRAAGVRSLRAETLPRGRALKMAELEALVRVCREGSVHATQGARDAALITVLYGAAVRRQEVVDLNLADVSFEERKLRVLGKGSKRRQVYLSQEAFKALQAWVEQRGRQMGPLFTHVSKGGRVVNRRLTPQAVYTILKRRQMQAGLTPFTPHDLRRSAITDLLAANVDVLTVSAIAGHASADTTRRYDRRAEETRKAAAEKLRSPYQEAPLSDGLQTPELPTEHPDAAPQNEPAQSGPAQTAPAEDDPPAPDAPNTTA